MQPRFVMQIRTCPKYSVIIYVIALKKLNRNKEFISLRVKRFASESVTAVKKR